MERISSITAVVVLGGNPPTRAIKQHIPAHQLVIAADSGLHGAIDLGLRVNVVIGDMDSVDKAVLAAVEANGTTVTQLPRDKDSTDAELALLKAVEMGATKIVLITKGGGRLDHELGVFAVLQNPSLRHCTIEALWDNSILHLIHGPASVTITGKVGSNVGLIAAGGSASGISTAGLKWALTNESLTPHSSRGISNQLTEETATISVQTGSLFVVQSSALST
jgi:thiamine pyrophosphokinase